MKKLIPQTILLIILTSSVNIAYACLAIKFPSHNLDKYETIFTGVVTGIHLTSYHDGIVSGIRQWADTTLPHEVTIIPIKVDKGVVSEVETLSISGCGVPEPNARQLGKFFVTPNGNVFVEYYSEDFTYDEFLKYGDIKSYRKHIRKELDLQE